MTSARLAASVAAAAAVLATSGDLLLLHAAGSGAVATSAGSATADAHGLVGPVILGSLLGVITIPLYALGYWGVSRSLEAAGKTRAAAIFPLGAYMSALGGAIHGMTGLAIHAAIGDGRLDADPFSPLAPYAGYFIGLWLLASALMIAISLLFVLAVRSGDTPYPVWAAWANPLCLILVLAGLAAPFSLGAEYLIPAAPNIAHMLFFAMAALILSRTGHRRSS